MDMVIPKPLAHPDFVRTLSRFAANERPRTQCQPYNPGANNRHINFFGVHLSITRCRKLRRFLLLQCR